MTNISQFYYFTLAAPAEFSRHYPFKNCKILWLQLMEIKVTRRWLTCSGAERGHKKHDQQLVIMFVNVAELFSACFINYMLCFFFNI